MNCAFFCCSDYTTAVLHMPYHARTHEESRLAVCLLCMGKTKVMRPITEGDHQIIQGYFLNGYDQKDDRLPSSLCGNRHVAIHEYTKGNFRSRIAVYDISQIGCVRPTTRNSKVCDCKVCEVARSSTTLNFSNKVVLHKKSPGKRKLHTTTPISSLYSPVMQASHKQQPVTQ